MIKSTCRKCDKEILECTCKNKHKYHILTEQEMNRFNDDDWIDEELDYLTKKEIIELSEDILKRDWEDDYDLD